MGVCQLCRATEATAPQLLICPLLVLPKNTVTVHLLSALTVCSQFLSRRKRGLTGPSDDSVTIDSCHTPKEEIKSADTLVESFVVLPPSIVLMGSSAQ